MHQEVAGGHVRHALVLRSRGAEGIRSSGRSEIWWNRNNAVVGLQQLEVVLVRAYISEGRLEARGFHSPTIILRSRHFSLLAPRANDDWFHLHTVPFTAHRYCSLGTIYTAFVHSVGFAHVASKSR